VTPVSAPIHLRPTAELAERVLLPGDPHRALAVAQVVLDQPRMFNHTRGLWGYTGTARDGEPLTVQSTGMGGPSAAIVVEELIDLGARTLVRIGTCGALAEGLDLGELVVAGEVLGADGTSAALTGSERLAADPALTGALEAAGARPVIAVSTDVFYERRDHLASEWVQAGAQVVEMEAAALLAVAAHRGVRAAVLLAVSDQLADGERRRLDVEGLEAAGVRLGETAWTALAGQRTG
jgi:DeoD family purine-nucleoside phosphorylase